MKVLLIGSGGREFTIAWKLSQSPKLSKLFIAPGNGGSGQFGTNVDISGEDFDAVKEFVLKEEINMIVVGPEAPLVAGLTDFIHAEPELQNIAVIGPDKLGATLEGSKDFAKAFMIKYNVPTAAYETFTEETLREGYDFLEKMDAPYVLKADGLAGGKGVLIIDDLEEAKKELKAMLSDAKFGSASSSVVIEEFLSGIELSVFVLTDGNGYVILPEAKDYKRIGNGDIGLNTGGMGAVSPVPFAQGEFLQKVENQIVKPTVQGIKEEGYNYKGFVFIGLMNVNGDPKVIEYNVRMGDPETEVVIPRLKSDLLDLFISCAEGKLDNSELDISEKTALTVMSVAGGYPGSYSKGQVIHGIERVDDGLLIHAGTSSNGETIVTSGGRVMACTAFGESIEEAQKKAYLMTSLVSFEGQYYRHDIGNDLM